jgi:hypothetical protein
LPLLLFKETRQIPGHTRGIKTKIRHQLSVALTAPRLRILHRGSRLSASLSEGIGSALKGGAKVCQHQHEVLRLLVMEFALNFGRKGATPIQRGFQSGLLSRIQAVKLIRHSTLPDISQPPDSGWSPVQRTRFTLAA